jgi:hypothetical protein
MLEGPLGLQRHLIAIERAAELAMESILLDVCLRWCVIKCYIDGSFQLIRYIVTTL